MSLSTRPIKLSSFLSLAGRFLLGFLCFALSIFVFLFPWISHWQSFVASLALTPNPWTWSFAGLSLFLIGILLIWSVARGLKHHYVYLHLGERSVALDKDLIQQYLEHYWQERFPDQPVPFTLTLQKDSILIEAELPYVPEAEREALLEHIEADLQDLFVRLLGYTQDVQLAVTFASNKEASSSIS